MIVWLFVSVAVFIVAYSANRLSGVPSKLTAHAITLIVGFYCTVMPTLLMVGPHPLEGWMALLIGAMAAMIGTSILLLIEVAVYKAKNKHTPVLEAANQLHKPLAATPFIEDALEATAVVITDHIQPEDYEKVQLASRRASVNDTILSIHLVSTGGQVDSANAIIDLIEREVARGLKVQILATGKCMSAATMILMAVPVAHRYATPRTNFMIHHVRVTASLARNDNTKRRDDEYIELLTSRANVTRESLQTLFASEKDYDFGSDEAVRLGIVGSIVPSV